MCIITITENLMLTSFEQCCWNISQIMENGVEFYGNVDENQGWIVYGDLFIQSLFSFFYFLDIDLLGSSMMIILCYDKNHSR
uniref:Uncharacterized protein n=1 Tax=Octopus bimaculoides TaxID=37653 RepID=A0A0L8I995_OCTBM